MSILQLEQSLKEADAELVLLQRSGCEENDLKNVEGTRGNIHLDILILRNVMVTYRF